MGVIRQRIIQLQGQRMRLREEVSGLPGSAVKERVVLGKGKGKARVVQCTRAEIIVG